MTDAVLRQQDTVHGCTGDRCCTEDDSEVQHSGKMLYEDSEIQCIVALVKDAVLRIARYSAW